jgi:hypothetical protein
MPITIPAFSQYQQPIVPLRGLWNRPPKEGDRFINAEIDWQIGNPGAVQFALSGNSPVALSQIVALSVDNSRCGADADFLFPDSGFLLTVPSRNQGVYPVYTNALMFYAISKLAIAGDVTILQVLNSNPPPVAIQPTSYQAQNAAGGISLATNATTPIVAAGISGTIEAIAINAIINNAATTAVAATLTLQDGTGKVLWVGQFSAGGAAASSTTNVVTPIMVSPLSIRFTNGVNAVVSGTTIGAGQGSVSVNVYYTQP